MINTPQELLEFMSDFKYEWMDKDGIFHEELTPDMYENYSLMTPEKVLINKKGICADQSEFERDWFSKNNYEHKVMVIQIEREGSAPGHQFLVYKENNNYYWFENAWYDERGIHEYSTYEDLIEDIKHKFIVQNNIVEQELNKIEIFEQIRYPYNMSYEEMDKYKYKEELKKILSIIEEKHIDMYFNISKGELNSYIKELLTKYELKDKYGLYYIANVIIKKIFGRFDSHTYLIWNDADFNLPIRLKYIEGKLYIIRTDEDNRDLLYGQILKINNIEIEKLIDEIKNMTAYSTDGFLQIKIETILYNGVKLKSLPSIDSDTHEFEYEVLIDNQIIKRKLTRQDKDLIDINKMKKNYSYTVINDVIYIVYNSCSEDYEGQMIELVNNIKKISKETNIDNFIIDLRGNMGGNADYIQPLIEFLKGKKIVTLTNNYIFSGGRWALIDLKNIGSKFIGTEIGTTLNCFGNVSRQTIFKYILPVAYKYFYYDEITKSIKQIKEKDEFIKFKNNPENYIYFEPQIFRPDYYVDNTIEDYKNGYDRQLDVALMSIKKIIKDDGKSQVLK